MALTDAQKTVLQDELTNDPLGIGYATMPDGAVADSLGALTRPGIRATMSSLEVQQAIDPSDYDGLQDQQKQIIVGFLGADEIDSRQGGLAQQVFVSAFGAGSNTITALSAARAVSISRAAELGLPEIRHLDVAAARSL